MLEATKTPNTAREASAAGAVPANPALAAEARIARIAVTIFPILVVAAGLAGFLLPAAFKPLAPSVPFLLGIIMFCMGLTLTPPDFASVAKRPWAVALGIVAHYVIMPGAGWLIAVGRLRVHPGRADRDAAAGAVPGRLVPEHRRRGHGPGHRQDRPPAGHRRPAGPPLPQEARGQSPPRAAVGLGPRDFPDRRDCGGRQRQQDRRRGRHRVPRRGPAQRLRPGPGLPGRQAGAPG